MPVAHWPAQLTGRFNFRWSNQGFKYLGIFITPDTSRLFTANCGKLLGEIKTDFDKMGITPFISNGTSGNDTDEHIAEAALSVPIPARRASRYYIQNH